MRLSKDEAIKVLSRYDNEYYTPATRQAHRMGAEALAKDSSGVVRGRMEKVDIVPDYMWKYRCSCCHSYGERWHKYCPNCGAMLDGDGNGEQ